LGAQPGQRLTLDVRHGVNAGLMGGIVLVSVSPIILVIGAFYGVVSVIASMSGCDTPQTGGACPSNTGAQAAALGMIVGGIAGTIAGVVLISSSSDKAMAPQVTTRKTSSRSERTDAWLRAPTWHDGSRDPALPRPMTMTFFARAF
jgi:hypothetical protein